MSLEDFLDFETEETNCLYDRLAVELKDEKFSPTKLAPPGIRHLSESMTVHEKHLLLWDILLNSTPNYRKAVSTRLRRIVAGSNSRSPSPHRKPLAPKPKIQSIPFKLPGHENATDIEAFIFILKDANPWWYVLNVDHDPLELSQSCYDSFKNLLNPLINWEEIWTMILPIIGVINLDGKVRLKPI